MVYPGAVYIAYIIYGPCSDRILCIGRQPAGIKIPGFKSCLPAIYLRNTRSHGQSQRPSGLSRSSGYSGCVGGVMEPGYALRWRDVTAPGGEGIIAYIAGLSMVLGVCYSDFVTVRCRSGGMVHA